MSCWMRGVGCAGRRGPRDWLPCGARLASELKHGMARVELSLVRARNPERGIKGREPRRASSCWKHAFGMTAPPRGGDLVTVRASCRGRPDFAGINQEDQRSGSPPRAAAMRGTKP